MPPTRRQKKRQSKTAEAIVYANKRGRRLSMKKELIWFPDLEEKIARVAERKQEHLQRVADAERGGFLTRLANGHTQSGHPASSQMPPQTDPLANMGPQTQDPQQSAPTIPRRMPASSDLIAWQPGIMAVQDAQTRRIAQELYDASVAYHSQPQPLREHQELGRRHDPMLGGSENDQRMRCLGEHDGTVDGDAQVARPSASSSLIG